MTEDSKCREINADDFIIMNGDYMHKEYVKRIIKEHDFCNKHNCCYGEHINKLLKELGLDD